MKYLLIILLLFAQAQAQVPYGLNSNPSARPTAFLDFDGQTVDDIYWRPFSTDSIIYCKTSTLTNTQMIRVFNHVAEDFRPFNINITTDSAVYFAAPITRRTRVIITPTYQWYGTAGGVAYVESFRWGLNTPCFVFDTLLQKVDKYVAEAASHEIGHTLGLYHQSRYNDTCRFLDEYHPGRGTGDIGWAPIMGNSYNRNLTLWHRGLTFGCDFPQNDVAIIASTANGITLKADDAGNIPNTARNVSISSGLFNEEGLLNDSLDVDYFRFDLASPGRFTLNALPYSPGLSINPLGNITGAFNQSSNIDIELTLMRNNDTIGKYNPLTRLDATIDTPLNPGTYYIKLNAINNNNTQKYGMLGSYRVQGAFGGSVIVPVYSLTLKAINNILQWEIIADEPLDKIWIEISSNGYDFRLYKYVSGLNGSMQSSNNADAFYRLVATTASGIIYYSKTIYTKQAAQYKLISNLINNDILINTNKAYDWVLYNMSGKKIASGRIISGLNKIQTNITKGVYILQLIDDKQLITEKIIKQ